MSPYFLTYATLVAATYWLMRRYMPNVMPRERLGWAIGWPGAVGLLAVVFALAWAMDDELETEAQKQAEQDGNQL